MNEYDNRYEPAGESVCRDPWLGWMWRYREDCDFLITGFWETSAVSEVRGDMRVREV